MQKQGLEQLNKELKQEKMTAKKQGKPYRTSEQINLERRIKNLKKFNKTKGAEFNRIRKRIQNVGATDYEMRKAKIYRENYMKVLDRYRNFKNYDKLKKILNRYRNPIKFYEFMKNSELLVDLTFQSMQNYSQMYFDKYVSDVYELAGEEVELEDTEFESLDDEEIDNIIK